MAQTGELLIIGGGPAGYAAALRASQLKFNVTLVEADRIGGVALNHGGMSVRSLMHSANIVRQLEQAESFGIKAKGVEVNFKKILERARKLSLHASESMADLIKKSEIKVISGRAKIVDAKKVVITRDGKQVDEFSKKFTLIATGAEPKNVEGIEPDGHFIWSSKDVFWANELPKSLLIVGGGVFGVEMACFFNALDVSVTLVEQRGTILGDLDDEIAESYQHILEKKGIRFILNATPKRAERSGKRITVAIEHGIKASLYTFDRILLAAGVVGNTKDLGLEATRIKTKDGFISASQWGVTDEPGFYAAGDVMGFPCYAHKAAASGILCVERMAGLMGLKAIDKKNVPFCLYGMPQIACVGETESKARALGHEIRVGRSSFAANGFAVAIGATEGFIKTVFDAKTGFLLGVHMIGSSVCDLIQTATLARTLETTEKEFLQTLFPNPTFSENLQDSVFSAFGRGMVK